MAVSACHAAHPDQPFGGLVLADKRTSGMRDSCDHQCLAIFTSVAETGDLEAAEVSEARRPGTRPGRAATSCGRRNQGGG